MATERSHSVRGIWLESLRGSGRLVPRLGVACLAIALGCAPPEPAPQVPAAPTPESPAQASPSAPPAAPSTATRSAAGPYEGLPEKLQDLLNTANLVAKSPGLAMGVRIGKEFNWVGAAGVQDLSMRTPMQPTTRFRVGSVSKNFLGTCILQLVGEKKLALTDTLASLLGDVFKNIDETKITVQNLLQHTSGIPNYTADEAVWKQQYEAPLARFDPPTQLLQIADRMQAEAEAKRDTIPIGTFAYSNTNYVLLAMIGTKADGIPNYDWRTMIRRRIVERMQLTSTSIPADDDVKIPDPTQRAYVNWWNFYGEERCAVLKPPCQDTLQNITEQNISWAWSAGSVISTAEDLVRYMDAEMHGPLLTPELLALQQQFLPTERPNFYVGLSIYKDATYNFLGHRGGITGFDSTLQYQKDKDLIIAVLSNRTADGAGISAVPEAVLKLIYPDYPVPTQAPTPRQPSPFSKRVQKLLRFSSDYEY